MRTGGPCVLKPLWLAAQPSPAESPPQSPRQRAHCRVQGGRLSVALGGAEVTDTPVVRKPLPDPISNGC